MAEWDGEALGRLRQGLYRVFASLFLYPEEGRMAILMDTVKGLNEDHLAQFAFHNSWVRLAQALQSEANAAALEREYVRLFFAGPRGILCPPNESSYVAAPGQPASPFLVLLEREYAELGLALSPDHPNLPDHVSVEMEAMAFLCGREAEAWRERDAESARRALKHEGRFVTRHLGSWFPFLAASVKRETRVDLYGATSEAADAFVRHDRDLTRLLTGEVTAP